MSLDNLLGTTLDRVKPDKSTIAKLIAAADRNIKDSKVEAVSNETRFDSAYKAISQLANAALQLNGYRTLTSTPGYHMTMLQALPKTIGLDAKTVVIFDALRKQRQVVDYSGDVISPGSVRECTQQAEALQQIMREWMAANKPEFLK